MELNEKTIQEVMEFLQGLAPIAALIPEFSKITKPLVKAIADAIAENLAEFKDVIEQANIFLVQNRVNRIARYQAATFTRQEAIMLSMADGVQLETALRNYSKSTSK